MTLAIAVGVGDEEETARAVRSAAFREALEGVPLHGVTTSLGVLTPFGVRNEGHGAVAVMLVGGAPGTAFVASSTEADGRRAGEAAAKALLQQCAS